MIHKVLSEVEIAEDCLFYVMQDLSKRVGRIPMEVFDDIVVPKIAKKYGVGVKELREYMENEGEWGDFLYEDFIIGYEKK
jgi:hypothetical protein